MSRSSLLPPLAALALLAAALHLHLSLNLNLNLMGGASEAASDDDDDDGLDAPIVARNSHLEVLAEAAVRVVFIKHPKWPDKVPLLVFIHGAGGQTSQWNDQIQHLAPVANILAIDLPGHGKSSVPQHQRAFDSASIVQNLAQIIRKYTQILQDLQPTLQPPSAQPSTTATPTPDVVLVCHSYGASLGVFLSKVLLLRALVLISPSTGKNSHAKLKKFLDTPTWLVNLWRMHDRWGGINSESVNRYVAPSASKEIRGKQLHWNKSVNTFVAQSLMRGRRWPSKDDFANINTPVLLICGAQDIVTPVSETATIHEWVISTHQGGSPLSSPTLAMESPPVTPSGTQLGVSASSRLQFPAPCIVPDAGHSVMVEQPAFVNAIISRFLIDQVGLSTMNLEWQTKEEKKQSEDLGNFS